MAINTSLQKLVNHFLSSIGKEELQMLDIVPPDAAFNYIFFLYKKTYGDYPTGELYKILESRFGKRMAA